MKQLLHKYRETAGAPPLWRNRDFLLASASRFLATAGMGAVVEEVASVSDEHIERGGDGITVVVLK